jgi:hypothetical protein
MKRLHIYLPLVAGILTPSLVIFVLKVFVGRRFVGRVSPLTAAIDILHRQFAAGQNLFLLMLFAMIPFVALVLVIKIISSKLNGVRLECIFWGGFIAVWGLTVYGHFSVWYPLYAPGRRMSSTAVIAFLFIPIYCLFFLAIGLVIGYLIGWGVSFLPAFQEGKKNKPAREEREDDKFSL